MCDLERVQKALSSLASAEFYCVVREFFEPALYLSRPLTNIYILFFLFAVHMEVKDVFHANMVDFAGKDLKSGFGPGPHVIVHSRQILGQKYERDAQQCDH